MKVPRSVAGSAPWLDIVIEIPRGGLLKRGPGGALDFVSPLPCPFNYGSIPAYQGMDGDFLDAVVLGPRVRTGTRVRLQPQGAIGLLDHDVYDDKLVFAPTVLRPWQRAAIVAFFHVYVHCKRVLNLWRGYRGASRCLGWRDANRALARAEPLPSNLPARS